jgi:hypothetical protein
VVIGLLVGTASQEYADDQSVVPGTTADLVDLPRRPQ